LKNISCMSYSFQKLTQFSERNNVPDAHNSDTNGFLLSDTCISSTHLQRPIWNKESVSPPWKLSVAGSIPFKNILNFHKETRCKIPLLLTQMVLFREVPVFLELKWICLFGTKWAFLHLENSDLQEAFLSKTNSILTGKHCSRCSCFGQKSFSLERYMCFCNSYEKAYVEQREPISTLKNLRGRKYSFLKLTHITQGTNVLDDPANNTVFFFWHIDVFLQLSWIGLFGRKRAYLNIEKSKLQEVFLSKTNSILTRKQCARCSCF
jgi:hypothetical protein